MDENNSNSGTKNGNFADESTGGSNQIHHQGSDIETPTVELGFVQNDSSINDPLRPNDSEENSKEENPMQ